MEASEVIAMKLQKYAGSNGRGKRGEGEFRAMSLEEVKALHYGEHIWFLTVQGDAREAKVNGQPKTWKRDLTRVELPIKYGIYEYATFDARDIANGRVLVELPE